MSKQIPLTRGLFATVDDDDYEMLMQYKWWAGIKKHTSYASTKINGKRVFMHRLIMNPPEGFIVDHISRNGLDNRRCNLRLATYQQNSNNRLHPSKKHSKYRGVSLAINQKAWEAHIGVNYKTLHLGTYRTQREAAIAYNEAALKYQGEFAILNTIAKQSDPDDIPFPDPPKPVTPYRGIKNQHRGGGWFAKISVNGKVIHLGTFRTPEEAARVYDAHVIKYGFNRPLNFPAR